MELTGAPAAPGAQQPPAACGAVPEAPLFPISQCLASPKPAPTSLCICSCPWSSASSSLHLLPHISRGFSQPERSLGQGKRFPPGPVNQHGGARRCEL